VKVDEWAGDTSCNWLHLAACGFLNAGDATVSLLSWWGHTIELSLLTREQESSYSGWDIVDHLCGGRWSMREVTSTTYTSPTNAVASGCARERATGQIGTQSRGKRSSSCQSRDRVSSCRFREWCAAVFYTISSCREATNSRVDSTVCCVPSSFILREKGRARDWLTRGSDENGLKLAIERLRYLCNASFDKIRRLLEGVPTWLLAIEMRGTSVKTAIC